MINNNQIELAKSWFVLAQICIILAGFFFTIGGITYSNVLISSDNLINFFSKYQIQYEDEKLPESALYFLDLSMEYQEIRLKSNKSIIFSSMISGGIFVLLSFILWFRGHQKIKNLHSTN